MWLYHCHIHTISWLEAQLDSRETESLPPPGIIFALNAFKIRSNLAFMPSYATFSELYVLRREAYPMHIRGGGGAGTPGGSKRDGDNDGERSHKRGK